MLTYLQLLKSKGTALVLASVHITGMQLKRHLRCVGCVRSSEFDPATEFEENLWFMTTFLTEHLVISGYPQVSQVYLTVFFK